MKTEKEIQHAHDLLTAAAVDPDVIAAMPPVQREKMIACQRVFCWILGHKNGHTFEDLLEHMDAMYDEVPKGDMNHV